MAPWPKSADDSAPTLLNLVLGATRGLRRLPVVGFGVSAAMAPKRSESELDLARRHVLEGRRIVAEQRVRVQQLREQDLDASDAAYDLDLFERVSAIFEEHLLVLEAAESKRPHVANPR